MKNFILRHRMLILILTTASGLAVFIHSFISVYHWGQTTQSTYELIVSLVLFALVYLIGGMEE